MKLIGLIACVALAGLAVAGCGTDSDSSSSSSTTTTTTKDAVCAARTDLEKSVSKLTNPATLIGGRSAITDATDDVKDSLNALEKAAGDDLKPQVTATKSAVSDLQTAVGNLGSGFITSNLTQIASAIAKVDSTSSTLFSSLRTRCGSS